MTQPFDAELFNEPELDSIAHLVSPLATLQKVVPNFRHRPHQKIISDALVRAFTGQGPRFVCVALPQQRGKSFITSVGTPIWVNEWHALDLLPGGLCGLMSYEDSLSQSWSVKVRRTIEANSDVLFSELRKDSRAQSYWETQAGGGVLAIGTAGSVQGRSITYLGLDDITKNLEQALSPTHQMKLWDLWTTVLYGRLQPWSVVCVTMVRWAPDDFIGRLKSRDYEGNPDDWCFIDIPAIADSSEDPLGREIGEPILRPQADDTIEAALEDLQKVKESISSYAWSTLWQQKPTSPEGVIFAEDRWRYWGGDTNHFLPKPEEFEGVIMSWDMAFKDERHHDHVVGQAWGVKGADRYLIDQVRGHWGFTETCERVRYFASRIRAQYPKAQAVLVEDKANGTAIIEKLRSIVGGLIPITPEESKLARAWSCQPLQLGGNLYLPAASTHAWVRDFTKECETFRGQKGQTDDQVDAMTQALRYLFDFSFAPSDYMDGSDIDLSQISALGRRI